MKVSHAPLLTLAQAGVRLFPGRPVSAQVAGVRRLAKEGHRVRGTGMALRLELEILPGGQFVREDVLERYIRNYQRWAAERGVGMGRPKNSPAAKGAGRTGGAGVGGRGAHTPAMNAESPEFPKRLGGSPSLRLAGGGEGTGFRRCAPEEIGTRLDVTG